MLKSVHPKLPMRDRDNTKNYYLNTLKFIQIDENQNNEYLILAKDDIEIHFFLFKNLNPLENYGQVYIRVKNIESVYQHWVQAGVEIHPNGALATKPWGMQEFSVLDPDHNLLTFGEEI